MKLTDNHPLIVKDEIKTEDREKSYKLIAELLVSDVVLDAPHYLQSSHLLMLGDVSKAIFALKEANGIGDNFCFKAAGFSDDKENHVYYGMAGVKQFFKKIYLNLVEIISLLVENNCNITLPYEKREITAQDALKKLKEIFYLTISISGIIISINSGDNQFLNLKFKSLFHKINFLHELEQKSDTQELYKQLSTTLDCKSTNENSDDLSHKILVHPINGWFFFKMSSSKSRDIFLNLLLFSPGFIHKKDEIALEINHSLLENKEIFIEFKQPKLGCNFCIFTSPVLKNLDISMPHVLIDVITDYCPHY